jgi:hypothetical protein
MMAGGDQKEPETRYPSKACPQRLASLTRPLLPIILSNLNPSMG